MESSLRIVTIGGYGFTEQAFLSALQKAKVDTFVDIRQRRGMRGPKYAFLNSERLQNLLAAVGIRYFHALDLAPTSSVRDAQKYEDRSAGTAKRDRTHLSPVFVQKYRSEVLARFEPERLLRALAGASAIALFCVEAPPSACHRSLAAEHLVRVFGSEHPVEHLKP
jgi:uncharacterized protein (DUF488 family)